MAAMSRSIRPLRCHSRGEGGFTLIELIVSMLVLSLVMMGLTGVFISSAKTIGEAKQRQQATALATRTMEQMRAVPYDLIVSGINRSTSAYGQDARIVEVGGVPRLRPGFSGIDEELVVNTTGTTAPLSPHLRQETVENTTYTVATYVTKGSTTQPSYNLTVIVTYGDGTGSDQNSVIQRSVSYSPVGCLSTSTHPFSGPCQPSLSAQSGITPGSISVVPAEGDTGAADRLVGDLGVGSAALELPALGSSLQLEQTSNVSATAQLSGVRMVTDTTDVTSGGDSQSADSDTDPSSDVPVVEDFSLSAPGTPSLQESGSAGTLTITSTTADTASGGASVTGGATCRDPASGSLVSSSQPCGSSSVKGGGSAGSISVALADDLPRDLPPILVAEVSADPTESRSLAGQFTSSTNFCSGSSPNCAVAAVRRTLGNLTVGALPSLGTGDTGTGEAFSRVLRVSDLVDTGRVESGLGARTPFATRSGTVSYWNDDTQSEESVSLASVTSAQDVVGAVSRTYLGVDGDSLRIDVEYEISLRPASTSAVTTPCDSATPCTARAESGSSIRANVRYRVVETTEEGSTDVTDFAVLVDLGGVLAETSYRAASDG